MGTDDRADLPRQLSRRRFLGSAGVIAANVVSAVPLAGRGVARAVRIAWPADEPTASPVAVTVEAGGPVIPDDLAGLGFERGSLNANNAGVEGYIFSPSNETLVQLVRNMGLRNIRIGGGGGPSTSRPRPEPDPMGTPASTSSSPSPRPPESG